jgi:metal-dependent hydrolase (beta-lactamase superfamily II)
LIQESVELLGFKMTDVKILLASHAHSDHVAGHALMQKVTGAKVYVMRGDDQVIAPGGSGQYMYTTSRCNPCKVDHVLEDRDEVKLGGITLVARSTPGHTRGCTTWTSRVEDGGKKYDVAQKERAFRKTMVAKAGPSGIGGTRHAACRLGTERYKIYILRRVYEKADSRDSAALKGT